MRGAEVLCIASLALLNLFLRQQQNQLIACILLAERWVNQYAALLAVATARRARRKRNLRRSRRTPYSWRLPRPTESWFEHHYYDAEIPEDFFRQQLRVSRATFNTIKDILGARLVRENSRFRACLPPEKVLALGLYRLGHGASFKAIASAFNVGKSTVLEAVQDVLQGLCEIRNDHIKFPETAAEVNESILSFDELCTLPNIVGALGRLRVGFKPPLAEAEEYLCGNQGHQYSIQAVANGEKLFLDFSCGFPGNMSDAEVLRHSAIHTRAQKGQLFTGPKIQVGRFSISPYLVGDGDYPLCPWLVNPYPDDSRNQDEIAFNKELSSARVQVELAFSSLRNRWKMLQKRLDSNITSATRTAVACAVLHNICIRNGDVWNNDDSNGTDPAVRLAVNVRDALKGLVSS